MSKRTKKKTEKGLSEIEKLERDVAKAKKQLIEEKRTTEREEMKKTEMENELRDMRQSVLNARKALERLGGTIKDDIDNVVVKLNE